jgi:hypothetical protein
MWPLSPDAYCPRDRRDAADRLASSLSLPATRCAGSHSRSTPETGERVFFPGTGTRDELIGRAMRAYFMTAARDGYNADQPSQSSSGTYDVDGREYVVLRNVSGPVAVYRIKNNGMLRRLKRWPNEFNNG